VHIYLNGAAWSILLPFSKNKNQHCGVALFREKIVMGFNFRLIQSISCIKSKNKNIEK
jgi:hypothetical protein